MAISFSYIYSVYDTRSCGLCSRTMSPNQGNFTVTVVFGGPGTLTAPDVEKEEILSDVCNSGKKVVFF